jgi:hypothetical protein
MRRILKMCLLVVGFSAVAGAIATCILWVHYTRRGPWATGTDVRAFLGTSFEMSAPEVERSLGSPLVNCADFLLKRPHSFAPACYGEPVDKERALHETSLLAIDLTVFNESAWAELDFFDDRLDHVEVQFEPYSVTDIQALVEKIKASLDLAYGTTERVDSHDVPGAYEFKYDRKPVQANLWVNPDMKKPTVSIFLKYPSMGERFEERRKERDRHAF